MINRPNNEESQTVVSVLFTIYWTHLSKAKNCHVIKEYVRAVQIKKVYVECMWSVQLPQYHYEMHLS